MSGRMKVDVRFAKLINTGFLACSIFAQQGFAKKITQSGRLFFFGQITLWALSRDILRGPQLC
jgi:hypothetical protein